MDKKTVDYIVFEGEQTRNERIIKRLIIALIVTIVLMFLSNCVWLYAWMQYDYSSDTSTVTIDGKEGVANYIGNDGDITNGENYGKKND